MSEILGAVLSIAFLAIVVVLSMRVLSKDTTVSKGSKYIIGRFVPDNSAPKLTDMIDYHKNNPKVHYTVSE